MNTYTPISLCVYRRQTLQSVFFLLFLLVVTSTSLSQTIYITSQNDLFRLNLDQCTYELVVEVDRNISDITFLPDGTLVGINLSRELFEIDTLTGITTILYNFQGLRFEALTSSTNGLIYTVDRNGEFWSFDRASGSATHLGNVGYGFAGDLAFFGGELYMSSTWDDLIIRIDIDNPANSTIAMTNAGGDGGGMYGIVTFALDCNNNQFYGIISGNYTILEVDLENQTTVTICTLDRLFSGAATTREFEASDPVRLLDTLILHPDCADDNGMITVIAQGGVPPYQFSLDGGPLQEQNMFDNLIQGDYEILFLDSRGCSSVVNIKLIVQEINTIDTILVTNATCLLPYGQINIVPVDAGAFQFSLDGFTYQSSGVFDQLDIGIYNVVVLNPFGCEDQQTIEIISIPAVMIADIDIILTTCGETNGSIEVLTQNGGIIAYSIDGTTFQSGNVFNNIGPGDLLISVRDENGCTDESMISMPASVALSADEIIITNPVCEETTGSASIHLINSTGAVEFSLNGQGVQFTHLFSDLDIGSHAWNAIDEAGCMASGEFEIEKFPVLQLARITVIPAECKTGGEAKFELLNAFGNIQIRLNGELVAGTHLSGLPAMTYQVQIIDDNGCSIDTVLTIEQMVCDIFIPNIFSPNGDGLNDEFVIELPPESRISEFRIFDRWGSIVFSTSAIPAGHHEIKWDGRHNGVPVNPGVYVYYLAMKAGLAEMSLFTGEVTVVR